VSRFVLDNAVAMAWCFTREATERTETLLRRLSNGGRIEVAQRMAGHSNARSTGLYDQSNGDISVGEVEGVGI
jgi:hypothetical protein